MFCFGNFPLEITYSLCLTHPFALELTLPPSPLPPSFPTISEVEEPGVSIQGLNLRTLPSTACRGPASFPLLQCLPAIMLGRSFVAKKGRGRGSGPLPLETGREEET